MKTDKLAIKMQNMTTEMLIDVAKSCNVNVETAECDIILEYALAILGSRMMDRDFIALCEELEAAV